MSKKFKNKYRVDTIRLRNWDYGGEALYFVTTNTKNREHFFGTCKDDQMVLSDIGKIAQSEWLKTFVMRPDMNLFMGEYVVMPDHFHAILGIGKNRYNTHKYVGDAGGDGGLDMDRGAGRDPSRDLGRDAGRDPSRDDVNDPGWDPSRDPLWDAGLDRSKGAMHCVSTFGPQSKNLASIIRGFKIGVTVRARTINPAFGWQPRFYECIIRDENALQRISKYILNNPSKWGKERLGK